MLSAIIATNESERSLVPTLAALVPGATAGLLSEVIVADAGSRDATAEVADVAGCRFMSSQAPLGAQLKAAAASTRTPWLLFLRAGYVPEPGWIEAANRFMEATDRLEGATRAAVFRPPGIADLLRPGLSELIALLRVALGGGAKPDQGLLIAKRFYDALGGHPEGADAEMAILRKIGRRRIAMLASGARIAS
ncbi:MAG: glycosyltransferase [Pseudolabrys sp.]|nr:glycosyltransferase [Pseudolabrys sp.]MSP32108.1 glycosyltransferase [Pseudolabrys sp.]